MGVFYMISLNIMFDIVLVIRPDFFIKLIVQKSCLSIKFLKWVMKIENITIFAYSKTKHILTHV